jgi:hypothetical protein
MSTLFDQIEDEFLAALAPMLKKNDGYLIQLRAFRGSLRQYDEFFKDAKPCAFLGILGEYTAADGSAPFEDLELPVSVNFLDDNLRGESARVTGSGVAGESPGLYGMLNDALALTQGMGLSITALARHAQIPVKHIGGGISINEEKMTTVGTVRYSVKVPAFMFTSNLKRVTSRL